MNEGLQPRNCIKVLKGINRRPQRVSFIALFGAYAISLPVSATPNIIMPVALTTPPAILADAYGAFTTALNQTVSDTISLFSQRNVKDRVTDLHVASSQRWKIMHESRSIERITSW